jgi:hypothetical protein
LGERLANDEPADVGAGPLLALSNLFDLVPQVLAEFDRDQVAGAFRSLHGMRDEQALHALQAKCELTLKKVLETIPLAGTVRAFAV